MICDYLVVVSAPSGTGKNTILNALLKRREDLRYSVSTTTRKPRKGEINGKHYYFCERKEFEENIKNENFLEYTEVFNHYYGTTKKEIKKIQAEQRIPILDIDIQGFLNMQESVSNVLSFFIMPPSLKELKNRLIKRGTENKEQIEQRLKLAENEITYKKHYSYSIINDNLAASIDALDSLIKPVSVAK